MIRLEDAREGIATVDASSSRSSHSGRQHSEAFVSTLIELVTYSIPVSVRAGCKPAY